MPCLVEITILESSWKVGGNRAKRYLVRKLCNMFAFDSIYRSKLINHDHHKRAVVQVLVAVWSLRSLSHVDMRFDLPAAFPKFCSQNSLSLRFNNLELYRIVVRTAIDKTEKNKLEIWTLKAMRHN